MTLSGSNDAEVVQLQEVCGVSKQQAVFLLRKHKTLEAAANAFFTDPQGALRDEPAPNEWVQADNLPAFQIEAEDSLNAPSMSRPPSRIDNRANVEAAVGQQFVHQQYARDDDLQRAIAISKQDMPSQESGVTPSNQHFGPANRTHYDVSQWAMTPVASSRELFDHPRPSKRRRLNGQPAFLRGSRETGYIAPLLNIYYHIPLARHAFLFPSLHVHSYGFDQTWWSGTSDENNKSLSVEASRDPDPARQTFLAELQCLMAFLENTERAYGSVDALADLTALKSFVSDSQFSRFIESWISAGLQQDPSAQLTQIFTSEALKVSPGPQLDYDRKEFHVLDAPVEHPLSPTLMDLMDNIIWHDSMGTVDDVWMERCAQVFTMRLYGSQQEGSGVGLEIPSVWYPERYMSAYKDAAREMRKQVLQLQKHIQDCDVMQKRLGLVKLGHKRAIKIREVLQAAAQMSAEMSSATTDSNNTALTEHGPDIQSHLQSVLSGLDHKFESLKKQKRLLQDEMTKVSRSLTAPAEQMDQDRRLKYILQGVCTKPNITYVRAQSQDGPNLIELDDESTQENGWKWWRFEWLDGNARSETLPGPQTQADALSAEDTSYIVQEISEQEVLRAAREEHDSVVLVYADQRAVAYPNPAIPPSLKMFVEQDNRSFRTELAEELSSARRPLSRNTSTTISDDTGDGAHVVDPRDLTPMSISGPSYDIDRQPASKPSGSDETEHEHGQDSMGEPPPYEVRADNATADTKGNKIGILAEQMLQKYGNDVPDNTTGPVQIEHPQTPLR